VAGGHQERDCAADQTGQAGVAQYGDDDRQPGERVALFVMRLVSAISLAISASMFRWRSLLAPASSATMSLMVHPGGSVAALSGSGCHCNMRCYPMLARSANSPAEPPEAKSSPRQISYSTASGSA
jgi:hypothetical protein